MGVDRRPLIGGSYFYRKRTIPIYSNGVTKAPTTPFKAKLLYSSGNNNFMCEWGGSNSWWFADFVYSDMWGWG